MIGFVRCAVAALMLAPSLAAAQESQGVVDAWAAINAGRHTEAAQILTPLAMQGQVPAQSLLGTLYDSGLGLPQDYAEAAKWYRLAAEQGDARAQVNLGNLYNIGRGVPQDDAEAVKWYRLAAEQGHAPIPALQHLP